MLIAASAIAKGFGLPAKTSNTKVILNGGQRVTFARPDGYFALYPAKSAKPYVYNLSAPF